MQKKLSKPVLPSFLSWLLRKLKFLICMVDFALPIVIRKGMLM